MKNIIKLWKSALKKIFLSNAGWALAARLTGAFTGLLVNALPADLNVKGNLNLFNRGISSDSMRLNATGSCSYIDSSPAQFNCNVTQSVSIDRFEQIAFTKRGADLKSYAWRSGNTATASGGNGNFRSDGSGNYFYINHSYSGPNGHQETYIAAAFDALTDVEVELLFNNAMQIFRPRVRRVWVPGVVAGGFQAAWARNSNQVIGASQ